MSILSKQVFVVLIFSSCVNFNRFGENQYLKNFPFKVYLQKLVPGKKFLLVISHLSFLQKFLLQKQVFFKKRNC